MKPPKPHLVFLEELHRLLADESRMDIGVSTLSTVFAAGAKRNIGLVLSNQWFSKLPGPVVANLGCRIITKLINPECIWSARRSMGLTPEQAGELSKSADREILVHCPGHPTPFRVRVDELSFPPPPDEAALEEAAESFLSQLTWSEDAIQTDDSPHASSNSPSAPDALTGDELKVFLRIAEHGAELTVDRCDATGLDRARDLRARRRLEAKGWITQLELTLGKLRFYRVTPKGADWARRHRIKAKVYTFKSGPLHEYLLNELEKRIGSIDRGFSFQRHSEIAREYGLQPDSVLHWRASWRAILEICCNNIPYEARNLTRERQIEGVDLVIAVTPNRRMKDALQRTVERCRPERAESRFAPLLVFDASEALARDFDWMGALQPSNTNME